MYCTDAISLHVAYDPCVLQGVKTAAYFLYSLHTYFLIWRPLNGTEWSHFIECSPTPPPVPSHIVYAELSLFLHRSNFPFTGCQLTRCIFSYFSFHRVSPLHYVVCLPFCYYFI